MDLIDGMRVFVASVETGSFAGAGKRLGISGKLASKYLGVLEDRLGTRLLQRTTRKLGMTAAGERLYARVPGWLDQFDELRADLSEKGSRLTGTLRVSAPLTYGELHVQRLLCRFRQKHPDLVVDLRLSDAFVDLAAEGIDLAIRIGRLPDSALIARKLSEISVMLVASPEYLARNGEPEKIDDLLRHDCIRDTNMRGHGGWPLSDGQTLTEINVRAGFLVNSARAVRDLCLAGQGIALIPDYAVLEDLEAGRLRRVLSDYAAPGLDIHAVYLGGRRGVPRRVRAFLDFLAASRSEF
ncbi:LysR family transcriptional regulator [Roseibium sp.]|uniref:LysR family transcriptional regulator n=1 Tax=Roseibium sp. TaxID=1936156 RepID=UPI003D13C9D4